MASAENRRSHTDRMTAEEINNLPALITVTEYARITGESELCVAKNCKEGRLPAVKCGRRWLMPKAKVLEQLGL